ncbi:MAG: rhomboid family intramembrane serine protease [Firmicutes bacterium RBG_13_65_8]|nr:MAG: rhomboid family intramembrane serine protease [Firmicutes bacterium RBG_13_65_8]
MIPVRDSIRSRRFPVATVGIIAVNVLVFFYQSSLGQQKLSLFFLRYGIVPLQFSLLPRFLLGGRLDVVGHILGTLVSGMFLHGNLLHLFGNMLYLWVFGDNVEDRIGSVKYVIFYVLTGAAGTLAHIGFDPTSATPLIGASGAIAGVLGAYFVSFPRSRVLALVPIFFFLHLAEVPAIIFLLFWFVLQLINGLGALATGPADVVAWWAHIGGFAAGIILIRLMGRRPRRAPLPPASPDPWEADAS